jgi:hypothetical protein
MRALVGHEQLWSGLAVFYVNVDPLFVASRLSKLVNALLCYFHPIAYPDFGGQLRP